MDYAFGNGFYIGNWNSTGTFGDARLEVDVYGGVNFDLGKDLNAGVSYAHYYYPGEKAWNSGEFAFALSSGPITVRLTHGVTGGVNKGQQRASLQDQRTLNERLTMTLVAGVRNDENRVGFNDFSTSLRYDLGHQLSVSGMVSGAGDAAGDTGDTRLILGVTKGF